MPLPGDQQKSAERLFDVICTQKVKSRLLSEMFKELPDRVTWADYYKVIPEPRALNNIKDKLEKGKYKTAHDLHSDIELVFANAIHFNEENSTISNDARTLQGIFKKEWDAAVAAGALPKIEPEESSSSSTRMSSRVSRTQDLAPPPTPSIRIPKKAATSTPSVSRTATLTPAPLSAVAPQQPAPEQTPMLQPVVAPQPVPAALPLQHIVQPQATPSPQVPVLTESEEDATLGLVRDKQGDELVQKLEATFLRCPSPGHEGWLELAEGIDPVEGCASIFNEIRNFKDAGGDGAAEALESVPEETNNKTLSFDVPISIALIENKISTRAYSSPKEFDMDLSRLFEKARRWHEEGTYSYGRVLVLQCLWQSLTSRNKEVPDDVASTSATNSATLDSVTFKGVMYSAGDWVHLANAEAPSKPIVAQVQRVESTNATKTLNLTWYWRPEQTIHSANRSFWEREVFKTGYTTSNPLHEILEPITCQFFPKYIRGRPNPPVWYPGRPLYVVESRYDSSAKSFSRIKNWSTCVPEGLRKAGDWEYMPIAKFANNKVVLPKKIPSPFLKGASLLKKRGGHGGTSAPGPQKDRSVITAAGGPTIAQASVVELLPEETVKHFDRDPHTNQLLWFSGPPIDTPRPHNRQPRHSLDYLYFLARQRERQHRGEDVDETRRRAAVVPSISSELVRLYQEVHGEDGSRTEEIRGDTDRSGDVEMSV